MIPQTLHSLQVYHTQLLSNRQRFKMSNNGFEGPRETTPHRARHQISRSISELSSPIRLHRHHSHHPTKEKEPDGRGLSPVPQTASMTQTRVSLDGSRCDGPAQNPDPTSRRASIVMSSDAPNGMPGTTTTSFNGPSSMTVSKGATEQLLLKERQKAIARERFDLPPGALAQLKSCADLTVLQWPQEILLRT